MVLDTKITFEEGWSKVQKGVTKLIRIIEGEPEPAFQSDQYMDIYTTIYNLCRPRRDYSEKLYDKYLEVIDDYTINTVLPSIMQKHDEYMLRELVKRWNNHKVMVKWLTKFFAYFDRRDFDTRRKIPPLKEVGLTCFFRLLVYDNMHSRAKEAVIALIRKEREGEEIDRELVKNVLDVYVESGMEIYEEYFESFMLQDAASYYSSKASKWIQEYSCPDYMLKSEECLKRERERVAHYLHSSTIPKLVEKVQIELLLVVVKQFLRDDKMDDLSRMYRLYHPVLQGLEPAVADLFSQHIIEEGFALIKQAEHAAISQVIIIRKVLELHDKYMVYVTECFQNHSLFHKALKEAFEILRNTTVAGISNAELLAILLRRERGS